MLILKHRSRSVTFSIQTFKSTLLYCSSATILVHTASLPVFYGFIFIPSLLSILSCSYFISPAHSIPHSRIAFSIDSYLLLLFLMLMFCLFFYPLPSIPLAMVTSSSYRVARTHKDIPRFLSNVCRYRPIIQLSAFKFSRTLPSPSYSNVESADSESLFC